MLTYVNKGYNARRPSTPENSQPQVVDFLKAHIEPSNPSLSVIIRKKQTHTDLARYLHAACLSPVSWTFATAIKKIFFKTWPGLTPELITKHLPPVIATTQGHLHQEHQNLHSTKQTSETHRKQMEKIKLRIKALKQKRQK